MKKFAYVRGGVVCHLAFSNFEELTAVDYVVEIPEGENVEIGSTYDATTGIFSPPVPPVFVPPTVGAIAFMRLFTRDERIKARELRKTDPQLDDFWSQLEDPRTDVVVMALPSIQEDIEYTLIAVKAAGLEINVSARKAEILSGQIR